MRSLRFACAALAALVPTAAFAMGGPSPGAVTAQTVKLPSGPGSVRGLADNASVSAFTGQVTYAVPIDLPAGPGGLTPSLSFGYDGGLGNGPLGVGWGMAQAGIQRSLRLGVPHYDATDEIELFGLGAGGQVVSLASGELRIEGQGHAIAGRTVDGGYELTDADGRVYRFGTTAAARKASGANVSAWYLEEIRDVAGNRIVYGYRTDKGEVYLDRIEWGPSVGGARVFRAALEYEPRADAVVSYRTGFRVESALRLARVRVSSFGGTQRIVALAYDDRFPLTRVKSVRVTSGDGVDALPETRFTYAAAEAATQTAVPDVTGWGLNLLGTSLFDVDNDGAMDLLRLHTSGHSWRRNIGGRFAPPAPMPGATGSSLDQVRLVDLDGDSVAEMVRQVGSQWVVHKLDRPSASWISLGALAGAANVSLAGVAIADVDGDRRMDVLAPFGSTIKLRYGTAAGLGAPLSRPAIDPSRPIIQPGAAATSFYDLNGDGLADAIHMASSMFYVYLGRGDGTFEKYRDVAYPWTGSVSASQIRLGDLDRDGLLDVAVVRGGNVAWYRGLANGAFDAAAVAVARPPGTDASVVVAVADANGNGSEDLVWSSNAGMWIVDLAGPTTAGMLIEVDNGLGQTQRFGYQASTTAMFAAEADGAPWTTTMPVSIPVTVTQRLSLASGEPARSSRLDVRDAIYDPDERRFIGFQQSTSTRPDPADGVAAAATIRVTTRYASGLGIDRVLRGQVLSERIEDGTGTLLRESVHDAATVAVAGLPADEPRLRRAIVRSTETRHHEGEPVPLVTRDEYGHDDEGRVIEARSLGRLDLQGDESITRTRYTLGRSAAGVRDRVCEAWLLAPGAAPSSDVPVSHAQTLFGDDESVAPLCDAGAGWPRVERRHLDTEARWVTTTATTYTASGAPATVTAGGVTRHLAYDAHGLHPVAETVFPSPMKTLRWQVAWDDVLQQPARIVEPDGTALLASYDGLGRLRALAREGAAPHVHHLYHASAPRPYVETFTFDGPLDAVPPLPPTWTPDARWRHTVDVLGSAGEPIFSATRLDTTRWLVSNRRQRDAIGRTTAISNTFTWDGQLTALVASALPATAAMRTVAYDALDRPTVQTLPDGTRSTRVYRAFATTTTSDGRAPVTTYLDGQARVRRTERTVNGVVEAVEATYDVAGRITAMRLPVAGGAVEHQFGYDTLGRLVFATDPDIGDRVLGYDDGGRLTTHENGAGQTIAYAYDGAGRLSSVVADDGSQFVYHYDDALDGAAFARTAGRLAWVAEPTGVVQHGYDELGRLTRVRRSIHGRTAEQTMTYGASGLLLATSDGDGFAFDITYDAAGRPIAVGDLWELESQDASGRVLREQFGNGVVQTYQRDVLGQATRIRIDRPGGAPLYDVAVAYNAFGSITSVTDSDGVGLDHTATFAYDGGARLTSAAIGSGPAAFAFTYQYDGLQNMIRRDVQGPTALPILSGQYRYGGTDAAGVVRGPRQLTSILHDGAAPPTTFDHDDAGRVVRQGGVTIDYNGFDQLIRVHGVPGANGQPGTVSYAYGHDGLRVSTVAANGDETLRFSPAITEEADGTRQLDVVVGDRLVARVTRSPQATDGAVVAAGAQVAKGLRLALALSCVALALAALFTSRGSRRRLATRTVAAMLPAALLLGGCRATTTTATTDHALRTTSAIVYYHQAVGAGPSLMTRADGSVLDERRYEPFGAAIDSFRELPGGGSVLGPVDYTVDPHNVLNKESDADTGWSDHGARWMAPETARWLTPDPPVKAPDPKFMVQPWGLHPYQYVEQNPILFWDPDGRDKKSKARQTYDDADKAVEVKLVDAYAVDEKHGPLTVKVIGAEAAITNTGVKAEVTMAQIDVGFGNEHADIGVELTAGQGTLRAGKDGLEVGVVGVEAKARGRVGPVTGGVSIGASAGFKVGWGRKTSPAGKEQWTISVDGKLGLGLELEIDLLPIARFVAGDGPSVVDTIKSQMLEAHRARWAATERALHEGIRTGRQRAQELDKLVEQCGPGAACLTQPIRPPPRTDAAR